MSVTKQPHYVINTSRSKVHSHSHERAQLAARLVHLPHHRELRARELLQEPRREGHHLGTPR